jgi:hypothetical protein
MSVAIVIPLIGLELVPMMPTIRLETVTKKNPKTTIMTPRSALPRIDAPGRNGSSAMMTTSATQPPSTNVSGRSRSVRFWPAASAAPPRIDARLPLKAETIVGIVLISVMKPPAATAPAPIWRA